MGLDCRMLHLWWNNMVVVHNKKQEEFENMILIPYVSEGEEENEAK